MRKDAPEEHVTDHTSKQVCEDIINLKHTSAGHQLHTFYGKGSDQSQTGTSDEAPGTF